MLIQRSSPGCGRSFCRAFIFSSTPYNCAVPHSSLWSSAYVCINLPHIRVTPASHQLLSLLPWRRKGQATAAGKGVGWGLVASSKRGEQQELRHAGGASSGEETALVLALVLALRTRQVRHHPCSVLSLQSGQHKNPGQSAKKGQSLLHSIKNTITKKTLSPIERPRVKPICHQECVVLTKH